LDTVKPLNIQFVPKPVETKPVSKPVKVHFIDEGLTSADVQSEELTDIVDLYLEEVVSDAKSRGVMSSGLEEFLKSPTIMGEWHKVDIVYDAGIVGLKSKKDRSVSIVRRALRN
jgi:hypothetical protein